MWRKEQQWWRASLSWAPRGHAKRTIMAITGNEGSVDVSRLMGVDSVGCSDYGA